MTLVRTILLILTVSTVSDVYALPVRRVPQNVIEALDSIYPGDKKVSWTPKRRSYTADFIYNYSNISVTFDKHGAILRHAREISFDLLPEKVKDKVSTNYPSFKIIMTSRVERDKRIEYDVEVIRGRQHYILNYHPNGYLIHEYTLERADLAFEGI